MIESLQLTILIPLYNEDESLPELHDWIVRVMIENNYTYEILFVDDGSTDNSWAIIEQLSGINPQVRGIRFNRNYGKTAGLQTGFQASRGQVVITMDADLQDSPDEIPELYRMIVEDKYDLVSGWKQKRYDPLTKTLPTKLFNAVSRWISGVQLHDFNCGLKAYRQRVVKTIAPTLYGDMHRNLPIVANWNGFGRIGEKVVQHRARKYGTTKFGLERFVNGFLDVLVIAFVHRFSKRPMHFFGTFGTLSFFVGTVLAVWLIAEKLIHIAQGVKYRDATDNPLFYVGLVAIILGVQLFLAGFLGEMLVRQSLSKTTDSFVAERVGFTGSLSV
ncbi:glycosyltransferase family 2 protein [Spirosoma utsteinense]|uniref:Glycosyltransferase involved in cell wall biosynthesis n=1 Tax=Spirosoma utsteinense TaxID=2585773 RepID=A0ABR6W841_9BACT|nr:glycosyltransferase family 2 protein [Spirosoma utsteinense]MBC3785917.1 glycosyltransferase involved in cell wall biosynthesis [Spirosoma utsteinense]MBC3792087.1 glycosyltransferase involved in cell wall biosynthesis [Spirosoma utsteinense]